MLKQKLELTWIGKDKQPVLEPRILIEDSEKSCGEKSSENMLIYGDNLLALKALEQDFAGKVKCVYIDPPFNTGSAFDNYDDGLEHSIWLDLLHSRITIVKNLISNDGSIMIHLDDNESDYCKVILDEVFGRNNFINRITVEARSPSAFSTVNPGVFKASEYILWYAKNKSVWENKSMRIPSKRDNAYNKFIFNRDKDESSWIFLPLKMAFLEYINEDRLNEIKEFISGIFLNGKGLSKPEISKLIIKLFQFHMLFDLKQVSSYLYGKLKLESFEEFNSYVYPYLLDKCSVRFDERDIDAFVFENAFAVWRETEISDTGAGKDTVDLKYESMQKPNKVLRLERGNGLEDVYIRDGKQISFYNKNVEIIEGQKTSTKLLTNIWSDISWEGIANEGGVKFKKGKKPERLIKRCLELNTKPGDIILDSFLGSGTTAAVAHKMRCRWIGIELGEHCHTHCLPRLKKVVDGTDQGGISKAVNWKGGGGFKYYYLAPSLLKEDKYGNWIIDERYNADMLAAAMAKHEGFRYSPDPEIYWKQGKSTEKDYIFTTTQFVTVEFLDKIHDEMKPDESLLICCKSFSKACETRHANINIRKIPNMLLGRCEFGREDYSLNIINMPVDEDAPDFVPGGPKETKENPKKSKSKKQRSLFGKEDDK